MLACIQHINAVIDDVRQIQPMHSYVCMQYFMIVLECYSSQPCYAAAYLLWWKVSLG